jgi:hypothetical protein
MFRKVLIFTVCSAAACVPSVVFAEEATVLAGAANEATSEQNPGAKPAERATRGVPADESKAKQRRAKRDEGEDERDEDEAKRDEDEDEDEDGGKRKHRRKARERDADDEEEDDGSTPTKRGMPRVHVEGDYQDIEIRRVGASIAVHTSSGSAYGVFTQSVCTRPCDEIIDGRHGAQFYFAGSGMVSSAPFSLGSYRGDVLARVNGGSAAARVGGIITLSIGGVLMLTGGLGVAIGDDRSFLSPGKGAVMLGVGAAAIAGGIVLIVTSKTSFEIVPGTRDEVGVRLENGKLMF